MNHHARIPVTHRIITAAAAAVGVTGVLQVLSRETRLTASHLQELISTAQMVQSHMEGTMTARSLGAWLQARWRCVLTGQYYERSAVTSGSQRYVAEDKSCSSSSAGGPLLGSHARQHEGKIYHRRRKPR